MTRHNMNIIEHPHEKPICWAMLRCFCLGVLSIGELKRMITWKLTRFLLDLTCFFTHQHEVQVASQKHLCKIIWIHLNLYTFTMAKVRSILTQQVFDSLGNFALNHAFRWDSMPSPPHLHPSHHTSCDAPNGLQGGYHFPSSDSSVKNDPHIPKHQKQVSLPSSRQ